MSKSKLLILFLIFYTNILYAQEIDTSYTLKFRVKGLKLNNKIFDFDNQKLRQEFTLLGEFPIKYSVEIISNDQSIIKRFENNKWLLVDTIEQFFLMIGDTDEFIIPSFRIEDFNKDGNQDLICWTGTNVNGNEWVQIYLNNPKTKSLIKLINTAERGPLIWDAPEYNKKDSTIHCTRISSNFGLSFESTYKLIGFIAKPLEKEEHDNTNMNPEGKGAIYRYYIGKKGKWKLKQKIKS